jgi:hypothetical protein
MHARAHEHWRCADALHTTRPTRRVLSRYITCNASGYEGTAAQRPFEGLRRGPPAALWFELICCVGQDLNACDAVGERGLVGPAAAAGEVNCFANDGGYYAASASTAQLRARARTQHTS